MTLDLLLEQFDGLIQTPADVKKLEQTILQWAVMGRLVPQDPTDEPAGVLLERIKAEKARLVKEKKIKRGKKLPPIAADEVPFELPNGWEWCYLAECVVAQIEDIISGPFGSRLKASEYVDNGIPIVRIQNIRRNKFIKKKIKFITKQKATELSSHAYVPGDIVMNKLGAPIGKACIVPDHMNSGIIVADVVRIRLPEKEFVKQYMTYMLNSGTIIQQLASLSAGTTRQRVKLTEIRELVVPIPPLAEQKRIVAKVNELFEQTRTLSAQLEAAEEARTRLQRAVVAQIVSKTSISAPAISSNRQATDVQELLMAQFDPLHTRPADVKALKQTILQLGVMGRLVPQEPTDEPASVLLERIKAEKARLVKEKKIKRGKKLPPITADEVPKLPSTWKWTYLNALLAGIKAGKSPQAQKQPAKNGEIGVLKVSAVTWGKFNPMENKALLPSTDATNWPTVKANDLLISRANTAQLVGAVVLVEQDYPNLVLSDKTLRLDFVNNDLIFKPFMLLGLRAKWVRDVFESGAIGTSSSMRNISQSKIRAAKIALPPIEEQKRIVARVNELFALCDELAAGLERAEAMRERVLDAALAQAVRG